MSLSRIRIFLGLFLLTLSVGEVNAQTILRDDFDDVGIVDPRVWRLPFDTEGTFNGRTLYRGNPLTDMPMQGVAEASASDGRVMELELDTYSPADPGNQFLGTDLLTKRNFARGGGLSIEARLRLKPTTAEGLVNGFFMFDVVGDNPLIRDEIDWEIVGNQAVSGGNQDPFTNYWNDGVFGDPGPLQSHDIAGLDLTQFQDYRIEWRPQVGTTPASIKWFVNNVEVRSTTNNVPNDPMKLHLNLWAPDSSFSQAYSASLIPTASPAANENYKAQVDWVEVNRLDTVATEQFDPNGTADGSFENSFICSISANGPPCTGNTDTIEDQWVGFGNTFLHFGETIPAPDGQTSVLMFGPFFNLPNASGFFQNVAASPGEEFEASIKAFSNSNDSIRGPNPDGDFNDDGSVNLADYTIWRDNLGSTDQLPNDSTGEAVVGVEQYDLWRMNFGEAAGTNNFAEIAIEFRDATGTNVLKRVSTPIFDGRDPNLSMIEDEWIQYAVNGLAPEGTAFARYTVIFSQSFSEPGAIFFDEASLLLLESSGAGALQGSSVPEPSAIVLSSLLIVGFCCKRRLVGLLR